MKTKGSVRRKSNEVFKEVIRLRKLGHSYTEIKNKTGISKSTINNWIGLVGLNLGKEHFQIQERKRIENHVLGTIASQVTRKKRKDEDIYNFIQKMKSYFDDPFFVAGIMLYEAEGSKETTCKFSNSDYRLILYFVIFIEKYIGLSKNSNLTFELFIHRIRESDLNKIIGYWIKVLNISRSSIRVYWKNNVVKKKRFNPDYNGQILVVVKGERILGSKLLAISDIILKKYLHKYIVF